MQLNKSLYIVLLSFFVSVQGQRKRIGDLSGSGGISDTNGELLSPLESLFLPQATITQEQVQTTRQERTNAVITVVTPPTTAAPVATQLTSSDAASSASITPTSSVSSAVVATTVSNLSTATAVSTSTPYASNAATQTTTPIIVILAVMGGVVGIAMLGIYIFRRTALKKSSNFKKRLDPDYISPAKTAKDDSLPEAAHGDGSTVSYSGDSEVTAQNYSSDVVAENTQYFNGEKVQEPESAHYFATEMPQQYSPTHAQYYGAENPQYYGADLGDENPQYFSNGPGQYYNAEGQYDETPGIAQYHSGSNEYSPPVTAQYFEK